MKPVEYQEIWAFWEVPYHSDRVNYEPSEVRGPNYIAIPSDAVNEYSILRAVHAIDLGHSEVASTIVKIEWYGLVELGRVPE